MNSRAKFDFQFQNKKVRVKTAWLSDIHLGFQDSKAELLLEYLEHLECETLYLVGDIVDFWSLKKRAYWPKSHAKVLSKLMDMAKQGVEVIYVPGNHDAPVRDYLGAFYDNVTVKLRDEFVLADGRRLLVTHGDELDHYVRVSKINETIGDWAYDFLLTMSRWTHKVRGLFGRPYWSLSSFVKVRIPQAAKAIRLFEHAAAQEAIRHGYDGVICGHLHVPEIKMLEGVLYCNDGDWIDSCSSLVESHEGELRLLHWVEERTHYVANPEAQMSMA